MTSVTRNFKYHTIYAKLLGSLIKKGKKSIAKKTLDDALLRTSRQLNLPVHSIVIQIFLKLNSFVEVKNVKVRRTTYMVPFGLTSNRRLYLSIRWLIEVIREDNRKICLSKKLSYEFLNILQSKGAKTLIKKETNFSQARLNRSNIHYRW